MKGVFGVCLSSLNIPGYFIYFRVYGSFTDVSSPQLTTGVGKREYGGLKVVESWAEPSFTPRVPPCLARLVLETSPHPQQCMSSRRPLLSDPSFYRPPTYLQLRSCYPPGNCPEDLFILFSKGCALLENCSPQEVVQWIWLSGFFPHRICLFAKFYMLFFHWFLSIQSAGFAKMRFYSQHRVLNEN